MRQECRERFPRQRGLAIQTCITVRAWAHACAVMHAGIANSRFPLKLVAGKAFPTFPVHAHPTFLRTIAQSCSPLCFTLFSCLLHCIYCFIMSCLNMHNVLIDNFLWKSLSKSLSSQILPYDTALNPRTTQVCQAVGELKWRYQRANYLPSAKRPGCFLWEHIKYVNSKWWFKK